MRFLRDLAIVAAYEVGEAVRTRLLQLVILAYAGGIGFATWLFVKIVGEAEKTLAATLGVPATERPGTMMNQLTRGGEVERILGAMIGESDATNLLDRPALALWIGAVSMWLLPLVVTFAASGSVATEVRSRSIRYLLCRTGRLQIGLGKLAGQLLLGLVAATIGSCVAFVLGMTLMVGNPPLDLALELANRTLRSALFALPFAGLGLAASQWIASPNGARVVGGGLFVTMPLLSALLTWLSGPGFGGRLADMGLLFLATTGWGDFWSTATGAFGIAALRAVGLATIYTAAGQAVFARRDL